MGRDFKMFLKHFLFTLVFVFVAFETVQSSKPSAEKRTEPENIKNDKRFSDVLRNANVKARKCSISENYPFELVTKQDARLTTSIRITPCIKKNGICYVQKGKETFMELAFKTTKDVKNYDTKIIKYNFCGYIGFGKFLCFSMPGFVSYDICQGPRKQLNCPLGEEGTKHVIQIDLKVPAFIPFKSTVVKIDVKNGKENELLCVEFALGFI